MRFIQKIKLIYRYFVKTELEKKILNPDKKDFFVVQIGACDGISFDPIYHLIKKYNWSGILIEPVPNHFNKLIVNYKALNSIKLLNIAIGSKSGTIPFYTLSPEGLKKLPRWAIGISSLGKDKNSLSEEYWNKRKKTTQNKEYFDLIKKHLEEIEVNSLTFSKLVENEKITKIDLLQIDAEGYDYEIIKSINFNNIKPNIIHFEIASLKSDEKKHCIQYLRNNGYTIDLYNKNDAIATLL